MEKIEKYRKFSKIVQFGGSIAIAVIGMIIIFIFGFKNQNQSSGTISLALILGTVFILFLYLTIVGAPMQTKLLKLIILQSLEGLVENVRFNRKKGYTKDAFIKLNYTKEDFTQYGCSDYYSFTYRNMEIESTTVRAFDEIKIAKQKGVKGSKAKTVFNNYFYGRIYIIPMENNFKLNIYGKKDKDVSRRKFLEDKPYNQEIDLKFKKYVDHFEVFYKDEKPDINLQAILEKLLVLRLQAKGPVSLFIRKHKMILCIDNTRHYEDVEIKGKIDENIIREYRKDVSMVLSFINSLQKMK